MSESEKREQIRSAAIEAMAEVSLDMSNESIRKVMGHLRAILRLCDDVR